MPVTAKDIARELQLSQPTVSRILSDTPGHRVSPQTRERVLDTARRLGYRPNALARSLRRGRTGIVGLYTNYNYDARNDFLGTIIGALQRHCEQQDLDLLLHSAQGGRSPEEIFGKLRDGRIDGLILHANTDDPLVSLLRGSSLPVVTVADHLGGLPSVTSDDAQGIALLVAHLWERGHRRFAYLMPEETPASVVRRHAAFVAQMEMWGVPSSEFRVFRTDYEEIGPVWGNLQAFGPSAVLCWNDRSAYTLLRMCRAEGVCVPAQMAVAGFDGFRDDKAPAYDLVTVACPWADVAARALEVLRCMIENTGSSAAASNEDEIRFPVQLLTGDTA